MGSNSIIICIIYHFLVPINLLNFIWAKIAESSQNIIYTNL